MAISKKAIENYEKSLNKKNGMSILYEQSSGGMDNLAKVFDLLFKFKVEDDKRKEKLKDFPNGFELEGRGRTCYICKDSNYGDKPSWYDKYGVKCLVCQYAINQNEIDPELIKSDEDWYSKYDLESKFNLKTPTIRGWVKKGLLKERILSCYGKGAHVRLYLVEDNKDFLPPKYMVKSDIVNIKEGDRTYSSLEPWYNFVDPYKHLKGYGIMEYVMVSEKDGE